MAGLIREYIGAHRNEPEGIDMETALFKAEIKEILGARADGEKAEAELKRAQAQLVIDGISSKISNAQAIIKDKANYPDWLVREATIMVSMSIGMSRADAEAKINTSTTV